MGGYYCSPCDVYQEMKAYTNNYSKFPIKMTQNYSQYHDGTMHYQNDEDDDDDYSCTTHLRRLKKWCPHNQYRQSYTEDDQQTICEITSNIDVQTEHKSSYRDSATKTKSTCSTLAQTSEEKCISTTTLGCAHFSDLPSDEMLENTKTKLNRSSCRLRQEKSCNTLPDYDYERGHSYESTKRKLKRGKQAFETKQNKRLCNSEVEYKSKNVDMFNSAPVDVVDGRSSCELLYSVESTETTTYKSDNNFIVDGLTSFISNLLKAPVVEEVQYNDFKKYNEHSSPVLKKKQSYAECYSNYTPESHSTETKIIWNGHKKYIRSSGARRKRRHSDAGNGLRLRCQVLVLALFVVGLYFLNSFVN